jgi:hypothetical protein
MKTYNWSQDLNQAYLHRHLADVSRRIHSTSLPQISSENRGGPQPSCSQSSRVSSGPVLAPRSLQGRHRRSAMTHFFATRRAPRPMDVGRLDLGTTRSNQRSLRTAGVPFDVISPPHDLFAHGVVLRFPQQGLATRLQTCRRVKIRGERIASSTGTGRRLEKKPDQRAAT